MKNSIPSKVAKFTIGSKFEEKYNKFVDDIRDKFVITEKKYLKLSKYDVTLLVFYQEKIDDKN